MSNPPEWNRKLRYKRGGRAYLLGLDVYYDFSWPKLLGHSRAQFPNGKCLAELAADSAPQDKVPALLLTEQKVPMRTLETDTHFYLIVDLPRYIREAEVNVALSYYAASLQSGLARMAELQAMASQPDVLDAMLTVERVAGWIGRNPDERAALDAALGHTAGSAAPADIASLVAALDVLSGLDLDAESVAAIASMFGPGAPPENREALLRAITEDTDGRLLTGEMLVQRTADRIADARSAQAEYQALVSDPEVGETRMQEFLAQNLWLLGLSYARMVPHQRIAGGTTDFALERHDGFQDILELKDPQDPIVVLRGAYSQVDAAPPASAYSLSPSLAQALAQVHIYRDRLSTYPDVHDDLFGLRVSRDPWIIIVIGRAGQLPTQSRRILTELNKTLHRTEVVPYDWIGQRSELVLANVEKYLLSPQESAMEAVPASTATAKKT